MAARVVEACEDLRSAGTTPGQVAAGRVRSSCRIEVTESPGSNAGAFAHLEAVVRDARSRARRLAFAPSGSVSTKRAPESLAAQTNVPPCASAMPRDIDESEPAAGHAAARRRDSSRRTKRSKMRSLSVSGTPGPESPTSSTAIFPSLRTETSISPRGPSPYRRCRSGCRSPGECARHRRRANTRLRREAQIDLRLELAHPSQLLFHQRNEVESLAIELDPLVEPGDRSRSATSCDARRACFAIWNESCSRRSRRCPWRRSASALHCIPAIGVRSSCEASERKSRMRCSDGWRARALRARSRATGRASRASRRTRWRACRARWRVAGPQALARYRRRRSRRRIAAIRSSGRSARRMAAPTMITARPEHQRGADQLRQQ